MAKIKEISYEQTIQLRQYEPVRISATVVLEDGDNVYDVGQKLRDFVKGQLQEALAKANEKVVVQNMGATGTVSQSTTQPIGSTTNFKPSF